MTLFWQGFCSSTDGQTATTGRGVYRIRWVAGMYILTAHDHHGLTFIDWPAWGRKYGRIDEARRMAERLETSGIEAEVSGG